jgi:hypothetical protein
MFWRSRRKLGPHFQSGLRGDHQYRGAQVQALRRAALPGASAIARRAALTAATANDVSAFDTTWQEGRAMTLEQVIAYALEEGEERSEWGAWPNAKRCLIY